MKPTNLLVITLLMTLQYQVKSDDTPVVDCTKQADGTRLVDPASCTNYYKCLRGVPIRKSCHTGYYFDDVKFECNYAALVDCKRTGKTQIVDDDLDVATNDSTTCTTPCPIINPVQCLCGNNNSHYPGYAYPWPYPCPWPYPYPYPYPPPPPPPCNHTTPSSTTPSPTSPSSTTPSTPTSSPCPNTNCSCSNTPCCCKQPAPSPCPNTQCSCSNTPCTCTILTPCPGQSQNFTVSVNGTTLNGTITYFMEHPISKRLYYEIKDGKKRLRKCSKGQIFDAATSSCKASA